MYWCNHCNKSFKDESLLDGHLWTVHKTTSNRTDPLNKVIKEDLHKQRVNTLGEFLKGAAIGYAVSNAIFHKPKKWSLFTRAVAIGGLFFGARKMLGVYDIGKKKKRS